MPEIYFTNNDYENAESALSNVEAITEEDAQYKTLLTNLINMESDGRNITELNGGEETAIRSIGNKYTPSGVKALNVLKYAFDEAYEELFDEDDAYYYRQMQEMIEIANSTFKLYPDPADAIVYIALLNADLNSNNLLNIYDITGKRCQSMELRTGFNISWVNVQDLQPGIYFFEVICNNNSVDVQKIVIE